VSLGIVKNINYNEHIFNDVCSGQIYMAVTDGLWEAFNKDGEMFGMDRLQTLVGRHAQLSAAEISEKIIAELLAFRGESSLEDDVTFVIIKVV
jgi:sigma-B regulation protein RsbU (phosphoserine phosphatase)